MQTTLQLPDAGAPVNLDTKRNRYIGGSDAAAILGLNKYRTRLEVYQSKMGLHKPDFTNNKHVERGNSIEPTIERFVRENLDPTVNSEDQYLAHDSRIAAVRAEATARYQQEHPAADPRAAREAGLDAARGATTELIRSGQQINLMDECGYIGGHPDGVGDDILWEFKAPTMFTLERTLREGLPPRYYYQIQHYMMLTGKEKGACALWNYDRWEPYIIYVDADKALWNTLRQEYANFWFCCEMGVEPPSESQAQLEQVEVIDNPELDDLLGEYRVAYEMRYEGEKRQKDAKGRIMTIAQGASTIITPNYAATIGTRKAYGKEYAVLTVKDREIVEPEPAAASEA